MELPGRSELLEAHRDRPARFVRRMNRHRDVEIDGGTPHWVMVGMPVALAGVGERRHPPALAAVCDGAPELGGRSLRIEQGEMRDRYETAAAAARELGNPPVVGPTIGERNLRIRDLAFP